MSTTGQGESNRDDADVASPDGSERSGPLIDYLKRPEGYVPIVGLSIATMRMQLVVSERERNAAWDELEKQRNALTATLAEMGRLEKYERLSNSYGALLYKNVTLQQAMRTSRLMKLNDQELARVMPKVLTHLRIALYQFILARVRCSMWQKKDKKGEQFQSLWDDFEPSPPNRKFVQFRNSLIEECLKTNTPVFFSSTVEVERFCEAAMRLQTYPVRSGIIVVLPFDDAAVGVLKVECEAENALTRDVIPFVQCTANVLAAIMQAAHFVREGVIRELEDGSDSATKTTPKKNSVPKKKKSAPDSI